MLCSMLLLSDRWPGGGGGGGGMHSPGSSNTLLGQVYYQACTHAGGIGGYLMMKLIDQPRVDQYYLMSSVVSEDSNPPLE